MLAIDRPAIIDLLDRRCLQAVFDSFAYWDEMPDILRYAMPAIAHSMCADTPRAPIAPQAMTKYGDSSIAVADPLRVCASLPFRRVLFPFGFATEIKSNDASVIGAAEQSWGIFRQRFRETPIEIRLLVSDSVSRRLPGSPIFRAQANLLMLVADAHNFACCDLARGFGFAHLTKTAAQNCDYLRYHFLDAMAYTLLDAKHLVAVHAACVMSRGHGVLFVGESGAGKSSMAYACARSGWTYISDDVSSVPRRRTGRLVIGNPQTFRFRPSASVLFPELHGPAKLRNGKRTVEIRTEHVADIKTADECTVDYVVFLNRERKADGPPRLERVSREESLLRLFQQNVWPAELSISEERQEAIERLLGAELLELTYGDFDSAIDLLEGAIGRGNSQ